MHSRHNEHHAASSLMFHAHGHRGGAGGHHGRGRPPGSGDDGQGDFTRGRKYSSDDLQLMLLGLLEQGASHGYELIKALQLRSDGFYSPSPGMVYPALTYIEELGYAAVETVSNKKSYRLLPAGLDYLNANRERLQLLLAGLVHMARKMKLLRGAMAEESGEVGDSGWLVEFVEARHTLKRAVMLKSDADQAEQKRVAAILMRAASEILGVAPDVATAPVK